MILLKSETFGPVGPIAWHTMLSLSGGHGHFEHAINLQSARPRRSVLSLFGCRLETMKKTKFQARNNNHKFDLQTHHTQNTSTQKKAGSRSHFTARARARISHGQITKAGHIPSPQPTSSTLALQQNGQTVHAFVLGKLPSKN